MRLVRLAVIFSAFLLSTFVEAQSGGMMGGGVMSSFGVNSVTPCSNPQNSLRSTNVIITNGYKDSDMTGFIQAAQSYLDKCNISLRKLGLPNDFYDVLLRETQQGELDRIKNQLELYAKNGKIDDQEKAYRKYAKKMGLSDSLVEKYLRDQKAISSAAFAKETKSCTPVDLSDELGPVRDQDSIGWCYAFASADLLSFKLKEKISAADIALTYNKNFVTDIGRRFGKNEATFNGGWPEGAMEKAIEKGLCLEKDLPSEDNSGAQFADRLSSIDKLGRAQIDNANLDCQNLYAHAKKLFPNVNVTDIQNILETTEKKDFISNMANKTCTTRIKTDFKVENVNNKNAEDFGKVLDEQMDKKNPVAIAYDASVLNDKRDYSTFRSHASVLAGRRLNQSTGQCEYLIRNSWGRGCSSYDLELSCKEGNIWVPKADIIKRSLDASYLK